MSEKKGNYYGKPLTVRVSGGMLSIEIGIKTLVYAAHFADWANPYDDEQQDYIRTFEITDSAVFAKDVRHAMLDEREDGSTPLSDFLDKMSEAALDDGSEAVEYGKQIRGAR